MSAKETIKAAQAKQFLLKTCPMTLVVESKNVIGLPENKFQGENTILVVQHQFSNFRCHDHWFEIGLVFDKHVIRLCVPYKAVISAKWQSNLEKKIDFSKFGE